MIKGLILLEISTYLISTLLVVKSLDDIRLDAASKGYMINRYKSESEKESKKSANKSMSPLRRIVLSLLPFIPGVNLLSALYASTTLKKGYLEDFKKADLLVELRKDEMEILETLLITRSEKLNHIKFLEKHYLIDRELAKEKEELKGQEDVKDENISDEKEQKYDVKKALYSSNIEIDAVPYEEQKGPTLRKKL